MLRGPSGGPSRLPSAPNAKEAKEAKEAARGAATRTPLGVWIGSRPLRRGAPRRPDPHGLAAPVPAAAWLGAGAREIWADRHPSGT